MEKQHHHDFVESYSGLIAEGLDRETDLATLQVYLQKLSDDTLMELLLPRLSDDELLVFFKLIGTTLRQHLNEEEYHRLFLRNFPHGPRQI
ncbi:MAG: cytoplasmic protein [Candidatus Adiutrix sp.]